MACRFRRLSVFFALACGSLAAQGQRGNPGTLWTVTAQMGMADTFQLTLGGTFGNGPAWQNKLTSTISNVFRPGDSASTYGWDTFDTPRHSNDWQAGVGYKLPVLRTRSHMISLGSGLQHWRFPSVKTGTNDWLVPGNLQYQTKVFRLPFVVNSDSWTLLKSPLPLGTLLHTQAWLQHNLVKRTRFQVAFKHGPAHTYSWNFYGTHGNRVIRYQTMLALTFKNTTIEGGCRKQWGLQKGIRDNRYWQFAVSRTFNLPLAATGR